MKRLWVLPVLLLFILSACGDKSDAEQQEPEKETATEEASTEEDAAENEKDDEQDSSVDENEDGALTKPGQTTKDSRLQSDVELLAIKEPNETIKQGPVEITIEDVKILKHSNIGNEQLRDYIKGFGYEDSFPYVQINYKIKNTEDVEARLNSPIDSIVLDDQKQIETDENEINHDHNWARTLHGKMEDESMVTTIISDYDPEDIQKIKLITGRIDKDSGGTLAEPETVTYDLETK